MNLSEDDMVSLSGSDRQPFHSTPVKKKPTFQSKVKNVSYDDETFEPLTESDSHAATTSSEASGNETGTESETTVHNIGFHEQATFLNPCSNSNLSSWDKWLLKKEKERRCHIIREMRLKKQQELEDRQLEEAKKVQQRLADITHNIWIKNKNKEIKEQKKIKEQQELLEKTRMQWVSNQRQAMSEEKVKQWKEKKAQEAQVLKQQEEQKIRMLMDEKLERQEKSKTAFEDWFKNASKRSKCKHLTYGYVGGLLVGYYDGTSSPEPSYNNPIPWKCPREFSESSSDNNYQTLLY